ncbi:TPA: helix-turn-helix domain-containing protein [Streptococcus suis]
MIGDKLKNLRLSKNLTQQELADELNKKYPEQNFQKGKISKWENNKEEPRFTSIMVLADFYGVSLGYFDLQERNTYQSNIDLSQIKDHIVYHDGIELSKKDVEKISKIIKLSLEVNNGDDE